MFLLVLDKNPVMAAQLVPDKLKFKQLIELAQLVCSCGISNVYKPIKQGKELQKWIKQNPKWTYRYLKELYYWCLKNINITNKTALDMYNILHTMFCLGFYKVTRTPKTAIFRYSKCYQIDIPTNTELPINECIEEYKKYVEWKKENNVKGYI